MSTATCPLCGATYLAAATVCADCRVALVLDPLEPSEDAGADPARPVAGPDGAGPVADEPWPEGDDEVGYDLDDWGPADREALTAALRAERIAHEWREEEVVVPERWADLVEELIDAIDHPDALDLDDDDGDGGAELLGNLYVAADVLSGDPTSSGAVIELLELAPTVADQRPPYGVDGSAWAAIVEQVGALAVLLEADADGDEVQAAAGDVRSLLRPLV